MYLGRHSIIAIFTSDPSVVDVTDRAFSVFCVFIVVDAWQGSAQGIVRGIAEQRKGSIIVLLANYGVALPLAGALALHTSLGVSGLWLALIVGFCFVWDAYLYMIVRTDWPAKATEARERALRGGAHDSEVIDLSAVEVPPGFSAATTHFHTVLDSDAESETKAAATSSAKGAGSNGENSSSRHAGRLGSGAGVDGGRNQGSRGGGGDSGDDDFLAGDIGGSRGQGMAAPGGKGRGSSKGGGQTREQRQGVVFNGNRVTYFSSGPSAGYDSDNDSDDTEGTLATADRLLSASRRSNANAGAGTNMWSDDFS